MILAATLLLQLASTPPVILRSAAGADTLRVTQRDGIGMIDASRLSRVGGILRNLGEGRFRLSAGGATFDFTEEVPYVRVRDTILHALVAAPVSNASTLLVPLQVITELLPGFAANLSFDGSRHELRYVQHTVFARRDQVVERPPPEQPAARPSPPSTVQRTTPAPRARARRLVIVDPGHGGPDHGMSGPSIRGERLYEKNITLQVSRRLRESLLARGIDVALTRDRDTLIALADRGHIANQQQGDLFVSIHVNAANPRWRNPTAARGVETYFLAEAKTEDEKRVEQMENEAVRFETNATARRDDPLSFVINDMAQNEHLRESSDLAARIQQSVVRVYSGPSRGVKQAGFAVLVTAFMPAVLVEIGFGTNREDAEWMMSGTGQRQLASAIADAVAAYLADYARRVTTDP